jgi:hypothetical protein
MTYKRCRTCGHDKPTTEFHRSATAKDGLQSSCKPCQIARAREYRQRQAVERRVRKQAQIKAAESRALLRAQPVPPGHKRCGKCHEVKPFEDFNLRRSSPDGRQSYCRACYSRYIPVWRRAGATTRQRYLLDRNLRANYGIGIERFEAMLAEQDGRCYICHLPPKQGSRLVRDHNHRTKAVRRLLCTLCNAAIGMAGEDPERLRRMADYLEQHG